MFSKYKYVYQVYKEGNFTRAAEKLFISQPSLSVAIKNIENKLGAELFERTGNSVKLTEVGEEYIAAATQIMNVEKDFTNRINDLYNLETGKIVIGGTNYLSSYILPRIITCFTRLYPKIEVELVEANSATLGDMVRDEKIDIIIDSFDENMDDYQGYSLASEKILLCVPKDRNINERFKKSQIKPESIYDGTVNIDDIKPVPLDAFKNEDFILLKKGNDMYNRAMTLLGEKDIEPNVVYSVDQLNISYALVNSGIGLCFITDTFFRYSNFRDNVFLYNVNNNSSRTLYIAHKKNRYCTKAMWEFIKVAREMFSAD